MNSSNPYMKTLALCLNKIVKEGYTEDFKVSERGLVTMHNKHRYSLEQVHVVNFYRFQGFSDPADNSSLYVIETDDGKKGTLIDANGTCADENMKTFMQRVEDRNKQITN